MANGIQPQGYFTTDPVLGGGSGALRNLLDPSDPAGAYRAFLNSRLFPADVGNYANITSSGALASGPFNLIPTGEGLMTAGFGAVNPIIGGLTRGAINRRNAEALETLANLGILETVTPADASKGFTKFLGYEFTPGTGEYRLAPDVELAIQQSGSTPQEYFESQYKSQFGAANELAQYLDQIAYTTQGNFFTKDFFGNPTPWSKYVDRQGNIRADALEKWEEFGAQDKKGVLDMFSQDDQGTQQSSTNKESLEGGGIDNLFQGQVSEPVGSAPDFFSTSPKGSGLDAFGKPKKFDSKGRRLAGGSATNLLQG